MNLIDLFLSTIKLENNKKAPKGLILCWFQTKISSKKFKHFYIIILNSRNWSVAEVSIGSLNASIVHPREVFAEAIKNKAASVIFVHNHPSGDPEPSEGDLVITKRLVEAGKILEIEVVDHIIITNNNFLSFKESKIFSFTLLKR